MIISRTPLRISLGGGGTDLPSYYRSAGCGFLVAAAITKYVYIAVHHNFDGDILLKYSSIERASSPSEVKHPLLREALFCTGVSKALEISSMADIPAGTGLGSSGAFTVGTLKALHAFERRFVAQEQIAEEACRIEIERLGEPVGKQDQYIAAVGGITAFQFRDDDTVGMERLPLDNETRDRLEEELLLFYTGIRRSASGVLKSQEARTLANEIEIHKNLDTVRDLGYESYDALVAGDLAAFGRLMTAQWGLKLERSPSDVHLRVDEWIQRAIEAGASGAKLVGAGDGGFLLVHTTMRAPVRRALQQLGLEEVRFGFDHDGTTTIVN